MTAAWNSYLTFGLRAIASEPWNNVEKLINQKLKNEMKIIHEKQQKVCNLSKLQTQNTPLENRKYPRVINTRHIFHTRSNTIAK
jgi:hypothetical protein